MVTSQCDTPGLSQGIRHGSVLETYTPPAPTYLVAAPHLSLTNPGAIVVPDEPGKIKPMFHGQTFWSKICIQRLLHRVTSENVYNFVGYNLPPIFCIQ